MAECSAVSRRDWTKFPAIVVNAGCAEDALRELRKHEGTVPTRVISCASEMEAVVTAIERLTTELSPGTYHIVVLAKKSDPRVWPVITSGPAFLEPWGRRISAAESACNERGVQIGVSFYPWVAGPPAPQRPGRSGVTSTPRNGLG